MLLFSLKICSQRLHLRVVPLHLTLEQLLLELRSRQLLLQLTILSDQQLFLSINLLDRLTV